MYIIVEKGKITTRHKFVYLHSIEQTGEWVPSVNLKKVQKSVNLDNLRKKMSKTFYKKNIISR